MENLISVNGFYNDNKVRFNNYLISQTEETDELDELDESIFFYGLSLEYIKDNLNNENTGLEFTITEINK